MQAPRHRPDNLGKTRLDMHVNVFEIEIFGYAVFFKFLRDLVQTIDDFLRIFCLDNPLIRQHRDMSQTRANIMLP